MKKYKLLLILIAVVAIGTTWGTTKANSNFTISPEGTGKIAEITSSGTFATVEGKAEKIDGIWLYQIDLGSARLSDHIKIHIALLNPENIGKVLNNPHAYIDIGVWYPDSNGSHILDDGTVVSRDASLKASDNMSLVQGNILLLPSVPMQDTLYILASIVWPKDEPKGEPGWLEEPDKPPKPEESGKPPKPEESGKPPKPEESGKPPKPEEPDEPDEPKHPQQELLLELEFFCDVRM